MSRRSWFAIGLVIVSCLLVDDAFAYRRHYSTGAARQRSINAIRSQVTQFESIAADADKVVADNQTKVEIANSRLSNDREAIASARGDGKKASSAMADAEAEMYEQQGADSDVVKAKEQYESARASLQSERERVLKSPEYLAEAAKIAREPERASELPKIQTKYLSADADYQRAYTLWEVARKRFNGEKTEALSHDERWLSASEDKKKSLLAEAKALNDGKSGGLQKLPPKQAMRQAQQVADQARGMATAGRAMLGALGSSMPASKQRTNLPDSPTKSAGK